MGGAWRLFVAVDAGDAARATLVAAQACCRRADLPFRWVDPTGAHLTLKFLGATDPVRVGAIGAALRGVASRHRSFALHCGGLGAFPNLRRPRVLWLGLAGALDRLVALQRDVERALVGFGPPPEPGGYHPHLTVGRARERGGAIATGALVAARGEIDGLGAPLPVGAIRLMRSVTSPHSARYTTLLDLPLGPVADTAARGE